MGPVIYVIIWCPNEIILRNLEQSWFPSSNIKAVSAPFPVGNLDQRLHVCIVMCASMHVSAYAHVLVCVSFIVCECVCICVCICVRVHMRFCVDMRLRLCICMFK
jgi:hypothetical protein